MIGGETDQGLCSHPRLFLSPPPLPIMPFDTSDLLFGSLLRESIGKGGLPSIDARENAICHGGRVDERYGKKEKRRLST